MVTETELIEQVVNAIERDELPLKVESYHLNSDNMETDGILTIQGVNRPVNIEIVKWAANKPIGLLLKKALHLGKGGILIADFINPNLAQRLKEEGIQFLDACGNAYIHNKKHFIFVKGNKATNNEFLPNKLVATNIFNTAGLKVIFALLNKKDLLNQTYRTIAEQANVALGSITKILTELKEQGFLVELKGKRKLIDKNRLFQKWVEYYPEKLRKKMFLGEYLGQETNWWKTITIEKFNGVWGGEIAAAKITSYLKPQDATVYIPKLEKINFIKKAGLKKETGYVGTERNRVQLLQPFWKIEDTDRYAPMLLVYADLFATGDSRNIEVAELIYKDYIDGYFKQTQ